MQMSSQIITVLIMKGIFKVSLPTLPNLIFGNSILSFHCMSSFSSSESMWFKSCQSGNMTQVYPRRMLSRDYLEKDAFTFLDFWHQGQSKPRAVHRHLGQWQYTDTFSVHETIREDRKWEWGEADCIPHRDLCLYKWRCLITRESCVL